MVVVGIKPRDDGTVELHCNGTVVRLQLSDPQLVGESVLRWAADPGMATRPEPAAAPQSPSEGPDIDIDRVMKDGARRLFAFLGEISR